MSFVAKVMKSRGNTLFLAVAPFPDGRKAWYFIRVEPAKVGQFLQDAQTDTPTDFEAFGEVLRRGWGDTPPQAVIDEMKDKYGYNPE